MIIAPCLFIILIYDVKIQRVFDLAKYFIRYFQMFFVISVNTDYMTKILRTPEWILTNLTTDRTSADGVVSIYSSDLKYCELIKSAINDIGCSFTEYPMGDDADPQYLSIRYQFILLYLENTCPNLWEELN